MEVARARLRQMIMSIGLSGFSGILAILAAAPAHAVDHLSCTGGAYEIQVRVENVKFSAGLIVAELYPDKEEGFLSGATRLAIVRFAARAPVTEFCMTAPGPGTYALSVFQDENANTDFDRNFLGLPKEPWGISNNPRVSMKGPRLNDALFEVNESGAVLQIRLHG